MLRFDIVSEVHDLVFENPITVRVYLYLIDKDEVGIRETQRALDIGSPSTASWHLNILVDKGIAEKLPSNRYIFKDNGTKPQIRVPVYFTGHIFRGIIHSKLSLLLTYIVSMMLLTIYLWVVNRSPVLIGINGALSLLVSLVIVLYIWFKFNREVAKLHLNKNKNNN